MTGTKLNKFDLMLCEYVLSNIRSHMSKPAFNEYVTETLEPATLDYLTALGNEDRCKPLLLTEWELFDIASNFEGGPDEFDRPWEPHERVHSRAITGVKEIRDALASTYADEWASRSAEYATQLERGSTQLSGGIGVIRTWVGEVRRYLRVMGATNFLTYAEGSFPTPACPEPPVTSAPASHTTSNSQQGGDAVLTAIVEVRDLLVSQRTVKDWYTTDEVAKILGRAEFTVREWARNGRINAEKKGSGRGKYQSWVVSHIELLRFERDGLLPIK